MSEAIDMSEATDMAVATMISRRGARSIFLIPTISLLDNSARVSWRSCQLRGALRGAIRASIFDYNVSIVPRRRSHPNHSYDHTLPSSREKVAARLPNYPYSRALRRAVDKMRRLDFAEPWLRHLSADADAFFRRALSLTKYLRSGGGDMRSTSVTVSAHARLQLLRGMTVGLLLLGSLPVSAEEIQGNDPASPGHFQLEQRFGYVTTFNPAPMATLGTMPRVSQHAVTGETEVGYSPTEWYEIALTAPYAFARANMPLTMAPVNNGVPGYDFQSGGVTIRQTFIQGDRLERTVFVGLVSRTILAPEGGLTPDLFVANKFAAGNPGAPRFVQEANPRVAQMITPIIGVNLPNDFQFIFNANMTVGIDGAGSAFEPSFRLVKRISNNWTVGIEHFANLGPIGHVLPWNQQMQTLYAVAETHYKGLELGFGVGYGLTNASRGLALKTSIGKDF
jgi:hypothetical protein